mmetsp:Transcript_20084/g.28274  ORF Transcript_20084/g.28274 Transcript_20084/m.28274 type:complete len:109 (+) Transcript_20084:1-327(+)
MDRLTTFADYRVPQLLRHLGIMEYAPSLANRVDNRMELSPMSMEELYIRAATVVSVDELVKIVKLKLQPLSKDDDDDDTTTTSNHGDDHVNAVKMDWYLWNIGDRLSN